MAAIVVIAYNRPHALERLLNSLLHGNFPDNESITIHISIDHSETNEVEKVATEFQWNFGPKVVEKQRERLGLLKHVLYCGHLTEKYGEIIVLEDDLLVAPDFYNYAVQALKFYANTAEIAGVSLFKYRCEENRFLPFEPLNDGTDVHFIQVASSWGQAWNSAQWLAFSDWLETKHESELLVLPDYMQQWGKNSWKRYFNAFLMETNRFFAFPSVALSTNFEAEGTHASATGLMQVPLQIGPRNFQFSAFNSASLKYDAYFELLPECLLKAHPDWEKISFDVDLYGGKPKNEAVAFRLTSRRGSMSMAQFGGEMRPLISNVLFKTKGTEIGMYPMDGVQFTDDQRLHLHYSAGDLSKIAQQLEEVLSFSIVIPYADEAKESVTKTIDSLRGVQSNLEILVVVSAALPVFKNDAIPANTRVIHAKSTTIHGCLAEGLNRVNNDLVLWLLPGTILKTKALGACARIFNDFKTIHWICGVDESEIPKNRWSMKNALTEFERSAKMSTEGTIFRKEIIQNITPEETQNMFYFMLSKTWLTVLGQPLVEGKKVQQFAASKSSLQHLKSRDVKSDGIIYTLLKPFIRGQFLKNRTLFSLIYRRKEQLPFVLRYDEQHNSYYLNEY